MPNYNEVFERIEKKYLIDSGEKAFVESIMAPFMEPDSYGLTCVTSVYYDTPECTLIERSLEKPLYKEKLRVRTYGTAAGNALCAATLHDRGSELFEGAATDSAANNSTAFVELKKKFDGVVYKRRVPMDLRTVLQFLNAPVSQAAEATQPTSALDAQIIREINAMRARYPNLSPHMATRCDRMAWVAHPNHTEELNDLRITFDSQLCSLEREGTWQPIIEQDKAIMEIKCAGPYPLWLANALSGRRIYPVSFSKYGTAYTIARTRNQKGTHCA